MPPKAKISREDIINSAVEIVRANGADALNARAIAAMLQISTQPIFSNFENMDELKQAVIERAYMLYLKKTEEVTKSGKYPPYKSTGMAYIRFAKEEKELFKLLYMRDRSGEPATLDFHVDPAVEVLMKTTGFDLNTAERVHLSMWACVHGFATMAASNFANLPDEIISEAISDIYMSLMKQMKEKQNEENEESN